MARTIPALGFGTSPMTGGLAPDTVVAALKAGYRHIDTARKYGTERAVGEAMRASGVPRGEIFLTTKVSHENLRADDFARSVDESLAALKVDYVDLLLVHWPNPEIALARDHAGAGQGQARRARRATSASPTSTSRCSIRRSRFALSRWWRCRPSITPISTRSKLLDAVRRRGMAFIAYCPLGRGRLFSDPVLAEIAKARGKSIAQIALRWLMQQNVAAIPRSSNPQRIADNSKVFDFTSSDDEMARIAALKRPNGRIANPVERVSGGWD